MDTSELWFWRKPPRIPHPEKWVIEQINTQAFHLSIIFTRRGIFFPHNSVGSLKCCTVVLFIELAVVSLSMRAEVEQRIREKVACTFLFLTAWGFLNCLTVSPLPPPAILLDLERRLCKVYWGLGLWSNFRLVATGLQLHRYPSFSFFLFLCCR